MLETAPRSSLRKTQCVIVYLQPLASTVPARLQSGRTDVENPSVLRSTVAEELLAKYTSKEPGESDGSESDREHDDEDLAQNSDSAVGKQYIKGRASLFLTERF